MAHQLTGKTIASTYEQLIYRTTTVPSTGATTTQLMTSEADQTDDISLPLYISTERIGIGVAAPNSLLEVSSDSAAQTTLIISNHNANTSYYPQLSFQASPGTHASPGASAIGNNEVLGVIAFNGWENSDYHPGAEIIARTAATPSNNHMPCDLEFWVHPNGGSAPAQVMTILQSGHVGIGDADPDNVVEISFTDNIAVSTSSVDDETLSGIHVANLTTTDNAGTMLKFSSNDAADVTAIAHKRTAAGAADLLFYTMTSNSVSEQMVIKGDGKVGIGATDPAGELDIYQADNGSSAGPNLWLTRHSGDPADDDILGAINWRGRDSGGNYETMGKLFCRMLDVTDGTEDSYFQFVTQVNSTDTTAMTIGYSGKVGIGCTPANTFEVRGKASDDCHVALSTVNADYNTYLHFANPNDNNKWSIYNDGTGGTAPLGGTEANILTIADDDAVVSAMGQNDTTFAAPSDERMKENMVEMTGALENISDFRCVHYNFIHDRDNGKDIKRIGIIAQDIYKKYPEAVKGSPDSNFKYTPKKGTGKDKVRCKHEGAMSVKYPELIPVLIKAIQELSAKVEALENA